MTNYANDLGSIELGGVTVGEVLSYAFEGADDGVIESTIKGETVKTEQGGRVNLGTVTIVAQFDYGDSTGQAVLLDDVITGAGTTLTANLIADTGEEIQVTGFATSVGEISDEGEGIQRATYTMQILSVTPASGVGDFDTLIAEDTMDEA
jgi:hypothetical protein